MKFAEQAALIFVFVMAVIGCSLPAADFDEPVLTVRGSEMEPLYGVRVTENNIEIDVTSTGCTKASHFYVEWMPAVGGYDIGIIRRTPDRCRRAPMIETIRIPLDHSEKNDHLRVLNPIKVKR